MSLTLETLSSSLLNQYKELPWENYSLTKSFQLKIGNKAVTVLAAMKRIKNHVPETEIVFTGKIFANIADIEINPLNLQVWRAVVNHFESQVDGQKQAIFDFVKINGDLKLANFTKENRHLVYIIGDEN
jgi:hypothetical protein